MPNTINLVDKSKPTLTLRKDFKLDPSGTENLEIPLGMEHPNIIVCFAKGDKTNEKAGAGWTVYKDNMLIKEESLNLGRRNTAFQAELTAIDRMAKFLLQDKYKADKIFLYTDNQMLTKALDRLLVKTKVCTSTLNSLQELAAGSELTVSWLLGLAGPSGLGRAAELAGEGDLGRGCEAVRITVLLYNLCWYCYITSAGTAI